MYGSGKYKRIKAGVKHIENFFIKTLSFNYYINENNDVVIKLRKTK